MLIPIGDDLKRRSLPFVGLTIIAANLLVGLYEYRLWQEGQPKRDHRVQKMLDSWHTEDPFDDHYALDPAEAPKAVLPQAFLDFIQHWGLIPADLPDGRWDRLVTHQFLHGDLWHLVGNLLTLWVFLPSVEGGLGSFRFFFLYLLSGIAGGLAHWAVMPHEFTPMIGASGAISGVIGAYFMAFGAMAKIKMLWNGGLLTGWRFVPFSVPAGVYVFFWIIIPQMFAAEFALSTGEHMGVAWFADGGGFGLGALFMLCCRSEVVGKVYRNKEGELELDDTGIERARREAAEAQQEAEPVAEAVCTYCQTPLAAGTEMTSELVKCGNPTCGRLNFVGALPEPTPTKRSAALARR
jgi:membrane associated rhomboid family serine protease